MIKTKEKILDFIKREKKTTPGKISDKFFLNRSMVHRHLKYFLENNLVEKFGSAPHVFYSILKKKNNDEKINSTYEKKINENFFFIDSIGKRTEGVNAFFEWCLKRNFNIEKKAEEYFKIHEKYNKIKKNNLFNATLKIKKTFGKKCCIEKLFYNDFYSIEIFGKTKLGQMLLYSKQNQDRKEMRKISELIEKNILNLIKREKIDSVVFVPPTVKREYQFMKILEKELKLSVPKINVLKRKMDVFVPQKTLKKLEDRIENATETFLIDDNSVFKKTLIVDDAVGSGASINQIACKLKENKNTKKVIGFAVVGSLNDFEVISEV